MASLPTSPGVPVAIIGAGLAGMSAALELESAGVGHRIFERQAAPGGHVVTLEDNGYRFDRTGHLLHLRDAGLREKVIDWIGGDYHVIQRRSAVFSHGVYTRYPFQANTFGLPPDVAYRCVEGFVRAHFAPPASAPKNFEEFCRAHFGDGISEEFMIPYNSRLWGVPPSEITSEWCQRFVPLPTLADVIAGAVGKNDRQLGYNANFIYPRLGIGALTSGMAKQLGSLELGKDVRRIDLRERKLEFDSEHVPFDVLVSTMPLPKLLSLCDPLPEAVRQASAALRWTHLNYLDVALSAPPAKDFHWVYVPEARFPFYRVGCYSHFSQALVPEGKGSLYVELVDRSDRELSSILPGVSAGLVEMGMIEKASDIAFARLRRIDPAYVIFDHAYYSSLETIRPFLEKERILSVGRYGGWNYSSMEDAIGFGRDAARRSTELL